jgi:hypothetical protein
MTISREILAVFQPVLDLRFGPAAARARIPNHHIAVSVVAFLVILNNGRNRVNVPQTEH